MDCRDHPTGNIHLIIMLNLICSLSGLKFLNSITYLIIGDTPLDIVILVRGVVVDPIWSSCCRLQQRIINI